MFNKFILKNKFSISEGVFFDLKNIVFRSKRKEFFRSEVIKLKKLYSYLTEIKTLINKDFIILFIKQVYKKAKENEIFTNAMAMVYITMLSIIPFLIFSFYIMSIFNFFGKLDNIISEIKNLIINNLAAGPGEELINYLEIYIINVDLEQLGIISFISLIFIIVFMLAKVEITFNKIWNVKEHRDLFKRFVSFWTFITLGTFSITLLLALSLLFAEKYLGLWLNDNQLSQSSFFKYILFSFNFLTFIIAYYFVPNTDVKARSALFAGVFSGILFILLKNLYGIYTSNIVSYGQLYGSLSIIPIFLLWLYLIWIIVLLGAVISYVIQHYSSLSNISKTKNLNLALKNLVPIAVLITIYKAFENSNTKPVKIDELNKKINISSIKLESSLDYLKENNLIAETENKTFVPLKQAENLSIWDLYQENIITEQEKIKEIFKEKEMQTILLAINNHQKNKFSTLKLSDFLK